MIGFTFLYFDKLFVLYLIIGGSMKNIFLNKLKNKEYISLALYQQVKKDNPDIIAGDFNLDAYNQEVVSYSKNKYQEYFSTMFSDVDSNIVLDNQQIEAILSDEDYSLVIAGAGTGKTTTITAKVKYLVDILKVDPSKIIVMSYTKKATEELRKRIVIDFNIPAQVTTFHSLGLQHIRQIFKNRKCYVVDENLRNQIFCDYFEQYIFPYKNKILDVLENFSIIKNQKRFIFGNHFLENYLYYDNFNDYFKKYKEDKLKDIISHHDEVKYRIDRMINKEVPVTIQNELVKSKGEAIIANFLYCNGIEYHYEKVYNELMPDSSTYKPDFTLELGGDEIYLEYFGLSNYSNAKDFRYQKIKKMKEDYHRKHKTKFIKLDYTPSENLIENLKTELLRMGFKLKPKTDTEILEQLLSHNPSAQMYPFRNFLYEMIDVIKSSVNRKEYYSIIQSYLKSLPEEEQKEKIIQFSYINEFYLYYQKRLFGSDNYGFDFSDMIYYANLYIDKIDIDNRLNYDYLIIDEYQDISQERYEFMKNVANRNNAKVFAVGDDWQSIYAFAGSKIQYIYNFKKYFSGAKEFKIYQTYRNSQELVDYAGNFIMKNENQIKKDLISNKHLNDPVKFVSFETGHEYETLKKLILKIHSENPEHSIMILARTNSIISKCFDDEELRDSIGTKIEFVGLDDLDIDGMTMHKSKGLTCDEVILIGLSSNFPDIKKETFWLKYLFQYKTETESIPFAEERRLFYVGLTRTKNYVYLLVNRDPTLRSPFIHELANIIYSVDKKTKK
ncbi:MAG: hypothetical protein E7168_02655 [Firmicutes bacterium]|nr:hypothetical protein [Bacillota bacterium]